MRIIICSVTLLSAKEIQKVLYYPLLDLVCNLLGISYAKHVAATLEAQPSFTHLGVLDKLMGHYRRKVQIQRLIHILRISSSESIPVNSLIQQHETNLKLIINHRRYLINLDVPVKFLIYASLPLTATYMHYLYTAMGI